MHHHGCTQEDIRFPTTLRCSYLETNRVSFPRLLLQKEPSGGFEQSGRAGNVQIKFDIERTCHRGTAKDRNV